MKSPNNLTESGEERALIEIQENFFNLKINRNQSSEEFGANISFEKALLFGGKFDTFLGDSEDSTEISFIVSNLSSSNFSANANSENNNFNLIHNNNNNNYNNNHYNNNNYIPKAESENDSENTEILNILTQHPKTIRSVHCRCSSYGNSQTNALHANNCKQNSFNAHALKPIPIKKISMAGKVLTSMDSTGNSEYVSPVCNRKREFLIPVNKPERTSNPLLRKNSIIDIDKNFHIFEKFQLNKQ